jgi:hypothetical protein
MMKERVSSMKTKKACWAFLVFVTASIPCYAVKLVVIDARAGQIKAGSSIDSLAPITLKEGERITVVAPDGKSVTLKGPFTGPPMPASSTAADPKAALAALVNTRDARTSSVGVIRAGADAAKLPEPWLIDMSRPGTRCMIEGETPVWWRPEPDHEAAFTVFPVDRSWRADFKWESGQDRQSVPKLAKFEGPNTFVIRRDNQEYAVTITVIPKAIDNDLVLSSWMLEKACIQQADALLAKIKKELGESAQ